ncbi:MAG: hypothetical protein ABI324_24865 [Ktedonobacteraceae bacterium]
MIDPVDREHVERLPLCLTREIIKRANGILKGMQNGEIRILIRNGKFRKVQRVQDFDCDDLTIED